MGMQSVMPSGMFTKIILIIALTLGAIGLFVAVRSALPCSVAPEQEHTKGSHGFRIFSSETFKSFEHGGKKTCIPEGWEPIGAKETGKGWARFQGPTTGVMIKSDAFLSETLRFQFSSYEVRLVYPEATNATDLELYHAIVRNAFENAGRLFGDQSAGKTREHTVLISPGIPGTPVGTEGYAYPDPHARLSVIVRPPSHPRSEELFIHAVLHLYNRFRTDLTSYQKHQSPIPQSDFQELEASWAEVAFRTSDNGRKNRLEYLYNVHEAIQTKNFVLITEPPFNDRDAFLAIHPSVAVPEDSFYLDYQYGHYVLAPLALVATEGLLRERGAVITVEELLTRIHTGQADNLFEELAKALRKEDVERIRAWMFEGATIPRDLVEKGADVYKKYESR